MENQPQNTQIAPSPAPVAAQPAAPSGSVTVQTLAGLNPVAAIMFKDFGKRERQRRETTLTRFQRHLSDTYKKDIDWDQLVAAFKALNDLGLGALITGRGQRAHRFKWGYSLRDVARAAAGEIKFEEMSKAPTGKTRIVYPKNYKTKSKRGKVVKGKASKPVKMLAAPIAQVVPNASGNGVEMMILEGGVYKKYEIPQEKKQLFDALLPSVAIAK